MKFFILLLLVSIKAQAITLKFINSPIGFTERLVLIESSSKFEMEKNSNFGEQHNPTVGKFSLTKSSKTAKFEKDLISISKTLMEADKILKEAGSSHNQLNTPRPHGPRFEIEGINVYPEHPTYKNLSGLFSEAKKLPWDFDEGLKFDKKNNKYVHIKDNKIVKEELFVTQFFCDHALPARCKARQWGWFYLTK